MKPVDSINERLAAIGRMGEAILLQTDDCIVRDHARSITEEAGLVRDEVAAALVAEAEPFPLPVSRAEAARLMGLSDLLAEDEST